MKTNKIWSQCTNLLSNMTALRRNKKINEIWRNIIRDCQKITFVMLNGFCPLSNPPPPPPPSPLFLLDNIKMDRIPTKIKWKIHDTWPVHIVFQVLKVRLIKICRIRATRSFISCCFLFLRPASTAKLYRHMFIASATFNLSWRRKFSLEGS